MSQQDNTEQNEIIVLVDFGGTSGGRVRQVTRSGREVPKNELQQLSGESKDAVSKSLDTIGWVATKTKAMIDELHEKPASVEVEFGIQITAEAGVIVAKTESQLHITAKLVWKNEAE